MTTTNFESLSNRIEQVVQEHIVASRRAAEDAVARAFDAAVRTGRARFMPRRRAVGRRRPSIEIASLAERLLEAVRVCPGETMTVIAARVGEQPRALHRPMSHLKRAGKVRSAGQRSLTRYFPMAAVKTA
jgi:hypothetical protein